MKSKSTFDISLFLIFFSGKHGINQFYPFSMVDSCSKTFTTATFVSPLLHLKFLELWRVFSWRVKSFSSVHLYAHKTCKANRALKLVSPQSAGLLVCPGPELCGWWISTPPLWGLVWFQSAWLAVGIGGKTKICYWSHSTIRTASRGHHLLTYACKTHFNFDYVIHLSLTCVRHSLY